MTLPRNVCVFLRLHRVAGVLVRLTDGSVRVVARCPVCGAPA
jgi:hypothetical protein